MMKNILRYLVGAIAALLFFFNVPVYDGHTPVFEARRAMAAANPAWIASIGSVAQLQNGNWSNYPYLNLVSYIAGKNKGGGLIHQVTSGHTTTPNNCTTFLDVAGNGFFREQDHPLLVTQCGALGDNVTDDTFAEQAGINAIANGGVVNFQQTAPAGELIWPPGTYFTTSTLSTGPAGTNIGINMHGVGRGTSSIRGVVAGPVFLMNTNNASNQIGDLLITNSAGSPANECVTVTGNTTTVQNLWMNCAIGIEIKNATDTTIINSLCDQCLGTALFINNAHTVNVDGFEVFGFSSAVSNGLVCHGNGDSTGSYDITVSGLRMIDMGQFGVQVAAGCDITIDNYSIDGRFTITGNPAVHRGVSVLGGTLHLGTGTISGWDAEGIFLGGGVLYDTGASISQNVFSSSATNRYAVANTDGTYIKTGGSISGGLSEIGLVFANGNGDGRTSISGTHFDSAQGGAFTAISGGGGSVLSASLTNNTMTNLNLSNNAGNTPIVMNGVSISTIANNIMSEAHPVTTPVQILTGGTSLITYNASNSGTFPTTGGTVTSTGNVNY